SPLYGATGADPNYAANANNVWEAPMPGEYTLQKPATKEYQICFKCHSGSVGTPATWSSTSGSKSWTDVGLEFNPYNLSGHPVVTSLNNYPNSKTVDRGDGPYKGLYNTTDGTDWDQLLDPWGENAGNQSMYCSDCHESNSSVAGPHGSDIKWMLAGTNKAWPYTTYARNGSNETEDPDNLVIIFRRLKHTQEAPLGDRGTDNGLFCANCHPMTQWTNPTNNVHSNGNHTNARCVDCHIRVPHGGKVSRLIASVDYGTYQNHIPPRYTGNGEGLNGSGGTQPSLKQFQKKANYSYNAGRCLSDSTALEIAFSDTKRCNFHGVGPGGFAESW
ncbi:MAG: hypothetical protein OEL66_08910, partial [Desulfobulbaceae bacterium]|nr:hypothetical protein [Desulfobulbaceae bacterium]